MLPRDPSPSLAEDNFFFQRNRLEPVVILSTIVSLPQEGSLRSTNSRCTLGYIVGTVIGSNLNFDDCDFGRVNFRGQIRMQKVIGRSPPPPLLQNTVEIVITVSNLDCTTSCAINWVTGAITGQFSLRADLFCVFLLSIIEIENGETDTVV